MSSERPQEDALPRLAGLPHLRRTGEPPLERGHAVPTVSRAWLCAAVVPTGLASLLWIEAARVRGKIEARERQALLTGAEPGGAESEPILRDQTLRLFTLDVRYVRFPSGGTVETAAYAPDGRFLATGSGNGAIVLWQAANGLPRWSVNPLRRRIGLLVWSPDSRIIVAGAPAGGILLLDARTGQVRRRLSADRYHTPAAAYRPDGGLLAIAPGSSVIDLWRAPSGTRLARLHVPSTTTAIGWSPDGRYLAAGAVQGTVAIWRVSAHGIEDRTLAASGHGAAWNLQWAPNGTRLAVGYADGVVEIYAGPSLVPARTLRAGGAINTLAWSPDGSLLAVTAVGQPVRIWAVGSGLLVWHVSTAWDSNAVAWSPDGKALALVTDGHTLVVWDIVAPRGALGETACRWLMGVCGGLGGHPGTLPSYMGR